MAEDKDRRQSTLEIPQPAFSSKPDEVLPHRMEIFEHIALNFETSQGFDFSTSTIRNWHQNFVFETQIFEWLEIFRLFF